MYLQFGDEVKPGWGQGQEPGWDWDREVYNEWNYIVGRYATYNQLLYGACELV